MLNEAGVNLVATILSLTVWCGYVCLFAMMTVVLRRRRIHLLSFPVVATTFIFVCNLGQTVCTIYTTLQGFKRYPDGPIAYFTLYNVRSVDHGWYAATDFWECAAGHAIDILMLWRLYIIWCRNMRVMYLPIVLTCFGIVECIMIVARDAMDQERFSDPNFVAFYNDPVLAVLSNDIVLTWYFTGMICYRLWSVERQKQALLALHGEVGPDFQMTSPYAVITQVLVQSGLLYSVTEAAVILCMLAGFNAGKEILNCLNVRMMGIVTVLIMLQLNIAGAERDARGNQSAPTGSTTCSIPVFLANRTIDSSSTTFEPNIREIPRLDNQAADDVDINHTPWSDMIDWPPPQNSLMLSSMPASASDTAV